MNASHRCHACIATIVIATTAHAQSPASVAIRVHVVDSSGAPVAAADASIMRGLTQTVSRGQTDSNGDATFIVSRSGADDELIVRKIGYQRASRFFTDTAGPASFTIPLARTVQTLEAVNVSAQEDVRRKSYFIGAEDIENSPRLVVDALDIVMKLRPDMIWGRAGEPDRIDQHVSGLGRVASKTVAKKLSQAQKYGYCAPVQNIWVNGARIRGIAIDPVSALKRVGNGLFINASIATVLGSIKPEHIAEIEYHPCTDMEGDDPARSNNAIMVRLKEGIGFEPGVGSYVATRFAARPSVVVRLLGVFDEESGDPMADVDIVDLATGTVARTTATGTVSLNFLPVGESQIKIQRNGFAPVTMPVVMSPRDTSPITVVLSHAKPPAGRRF